MAGAEQHKLREYLLGQFTEAEEEQIELALLTDPAFAEEYDIVVDEMTHDYVAGKFEGGELKQVEQHFFQSRERQDKLKFALAFKARKSEMKPDKGKKLWYMPYLAIAASLLLAAGGFYIWRVQSYNSELNKGLAALQSAFRDERPLEARISKLDYAPYLTTRGSGTGNVDQGELRLAELTLLEAQKKNPTPAVRHALGKVYLAKRQFDEAIREFDEALKNDNKNAQLYSDLGAAWLEKGKIDRGGKEPGKGMEELGRSLEALNKALELDNNLLEALFNRALARQNLQLATQAQEDWREYLNRDSGSRWADDARANLKLLEEQKTRASRTKAQILEDFLNAYEQGNDDDARKLLRQNYTSAGNSITNSILDSYLASHRNKQSDEAAGKLKAVFYVAQLEAGDAGDRFTTDTAQFYSLATSEQIPLLIQAREYMDKGYENFTTSNINQAIEDYGKARQIFDRLGNVSEATFAAYRIGHGYALQPSIEKAQIIFQPVVSVSEKKNYKWLLSQCAYGAANLELNRGEYSKAIEKSEQALRLSEELHDANTIIKNLIQLADKYQALNNLPKSLGFLQRALEMINESYPEPVQIWGSYLAVAFNLNSLNLYKAALEFQKEALVLALEMNRPLILSRTYEYLGLTYGNLKMFDEAIKTTNLALAVGKSFSAEASGQNMMAHSSLQLANLYRQKGDFAQAIETYNQSIQLYNQLEFQYYSYAAHKGKLLCFIARRDDSATEQELQTVLQLFEKNRARINEDSNRNNFFDVEQQIYDLALEFAYSTRRDVRGAFEYSEQSHARSLWDMTLQSPAVLTKEDGPELHLSTVSKSLTLDEIQREMPERAQIVQYAILDNKLIIWLITRTNVSAVDSEINIELLNQKIERFLKRVSSASENENDALAHDARELYMLLIRPIEPHLDETKLLCIVPDKLLHYVPYGALVSPSSGKYLIEDYALSFAPSSSVFLNCSKSAAKRAGVKNETLLSVGDPAFDQASFPTLPALPSARNEAESIVTYYQDSSLFVAGGATRRAVRSRFEKSDVIHLALHYVPNDKSSLLSELVLAKETTKDSVGNPSSQSGLTAYDVYQMKLPRTRLVVLSACQTGIERHYRGEGPIGIARPFIAAGVPMVIASLWRVDSQSTAELMSDFHRNRRRNSLSSVEALRQAQRDMIANKNPRFHKPYYWASFVPIGGYADF